MSKDINQSCGRTDLLREYAFEELAPVERGAVEQHVASCEECSLELDRLRLTVAALRVIPDQEIPRRIAFVSDSPARKNWFGAFWNSAARLGFASACVLSLAMVTLAWHWPAEAPVAAQPSTVQSGLSQQQMDAAVARAVAQVQAEVKTEDERTLKAALEASEQKHEQEHRALLVAMEENMTVLQKRLNTLNTYAMLASSDDGRPAGGQ
jgi:anti-sigma factor RsiW